MKKLNFIVEVVWAFFIIASMIYDAIMGISNHDAYYIAWVILDYIILHMSIKKMKEYIDIKDYMC